MQKSLLIIDDEPEILEIYEEILEGSFYKISKACDIEGAISRLRANLFTLVILDINLHGRNGAEVLRFLMDNPDNPNHLTPFIISSAAINAKFIEKNDKRFAGLLIKPFNHEDLFHLVDRIINLEENETKESVSEIAEAIDESHSVELPDTPVTTPGSGDEIPYLKCSLPFPVQNLEVMVNKALDQIKKNPQMKSLFSKLKIDRNTDNYSQTRIGLLINIATGIAEKLDWGSDKTLEKFVYAAYLHDMALTGKPELAKILNSDKLESLKNTLSENDYKLVFNHPEMAAKTLEEHKEIPADVVAMVRQHHELPAGRGFPAKITYHKITPLSTVFIVSHDLTDYIMNDPNWKLDLYLQKFKGKFKGVHFLKVMAVLKEM